MHYLALAAPFFFSGMALGFLLSASPESAGRTYAVNLVGSATSCLTALVAPSYLGGDGMVTLSIALAALAGISYISRREPWQPVVFATWVLFTFSFSDLGLRLTGNSPLAFLELHISPYKRLSYALQYPGAASVVASILAALLALTFGFSRVLRIGALCYAGAWLTARMWADSLRPRNR